MYVYENLVRVMDSWMVHGDCVSKNVAITIIFLYAMLEMALFSLLWRVASLEGLFSSYKTP